MPGKSWAKPRADVPKAAKAPWEMMPVGGSLVLGFLEDGERGEVWGDGREELPWGWYPKMYLRVGGRTWERWRRAGK